MVFPNGLSLSKDQRFFVFTEAGRLRRYWLKGDKAGTSDVFAVLTGSPDNVRANGKGEFWVAIQGFHNRLTLYSAANPKFRLFTLRLPVPEKWWWIYRMGRPPGGIAVKYSAEGELLWVLEDEGGEVVRLMSQVHEQDGKLWMGSVLLSHMAVHDLP
uniref:Strictosidine synthase n=1 Tax=Kalanchoe fedtschenkoi TaxID=63787 RepID=A0A7N0RJP9_KALFE